ncbi:MAG: VOC family protein [Candidatus Binatia bacterium]
MFRRIDHVAFHVADLGRSVEFYEKHFGFKKYFQHEATGGMQIAYLKLGDTVLELTHRAGERPAGFHFCLEAENFNQAVTELEETGVEIVRPPHDTPAREPREKGWRRVVFRGPDGEQIEVRG